MGELQKAIGEEYNGPSGALRKSQWLTNEDLPPGVDVKVKIKRVLKYKEVTFEMGRTEKNVYGLEFEGKERILVVNQGTRKILRKAYGNLVGGWKGKEVTLYVTQCQLAGATVNCIRLRDPGARAATAAEEYLHTDEPATGEPEEVNGHDVHREAFERGAEVLGLSVEQRDEVLADHDGDYVRAHAELNRRANAA